MKYKSPIRHEPELADSHPYIAGIRKRISTRSWNPLNQRAQSEKLDQYVFVVRVRIGEYGLIFPLTSLADRKL